MKKKTHGLFDPCGHQFAPPFGAKGICPECGHCDACAEIGMVGVGVEEVAQMAYDIDRNTNPEDYISTHWNEIKDHQKESWRKLARSVLAALKAVQK